MGLITIQLQNVRFFSNHGLYAEEAQTGAFFEADIVLTYTPEAKAVQSIGETIDYVAVYELLRSSVEKRTELLETTVMELCALLKEKFPQIRFVKVSLKKLSPPITNFTGAVSITYEETY